MNFGSGGKLSSGKGVVSIILIKELRELSNKKIISLIRLSGFDNYEYMSIKDFVDFIIENANNYEELKKKFQNTILNADELRNLISARKTSSNLNEMLTQFFMMAGKLDCDIIFTYQVYTSQIDLQFREITDLNLNCERVLENGDMLPFKYARMRIPTFNLKHNDLRPENLVPIAIKATLMLYIDEKLISTGKSVLIPFDKVKEAGQHYNTRELIILDRTQYLSKKR